MNFKVILLIIWCIVICNSHALNPYEVLELPETASEDEVRVKYRALKKVSKDDKARLQLIDQAYEQIMIESTLQMTLSDEEKKADEPKQGSRKRRRRRGMPRLSDMFRNDYFAPKSGKSQKQKTLEAEDRKNYAEQTKAEQIEQTVQTEPEYEYRLPPEFDDPSFYKDQKKAQKTIKEERVAFNKKAAGYILFFAGILLKLSPCICIFLIWKCKRRNQRDQDNNDNPFVKAMNGWAGRNRRPANKKKN